MSLVQSRLLYCVNSASIRLLTASKDKQKRHQNPHHLAPNYGTLKGHVLIFNAILSLMKTLLVIKDYKEACIMDNNVKTPNHQLKRARALKGWSQNDIAKRINTDPKNVGRWERGETSPTSYYRQQLCELFGQNAEELGFVESEAKKSATELPLESSTTVPDTTPPSQTTIDNVLSTPTKHSLHPWLLFTSLLFFALVVAGAALLPPLILKKAPPTLHIGPHLLYTYYAPPKVEIFDVRWSPHGDYLACVNEDDTTQVIAYQDGVYRPTILTSATNSISWSPDETRIASASLDKTIRIWDIVNGSTLLSYQGHTSNISDVSWSPNGKWIASSDRSGNVRVWDANTGKTITTYHNHQGIVWWIAWSPDSQYLASGGLDKTVQVWSASTGKTLFTYRGHTGTIYDVMWSPDGKRIASASEDKTVQVWDATTGDHILVYHGHTKSVQAAEWSPDGTRIASAGADMKVHIWNATTGKDLSTYTGHKNIVWVVTWAPDGKYIASASSDGTVQIWQPG